jgi:putative PEP-CTERM system histidine kinase
LLLAFGHKQVRWVRVQVSKHFYRFRYDYREEWLRLTNTLVSESDGLSLPKRAIKGLADIVGSEAGALFISEPGSRTYVAAASWKMDGLLSLEEYEADDLLALMERAAWIVDSVEYKVSAPKASPTFLDDILSRTQCELLVVPLLVQSTLFGFVVIERPATLTRLSFEDIDLLRTGGRSVAGLLGQYYLAQRLTEAKQFEEFGRMTAFLLHDLTNISAQQSLILQNAERHKGNAQFIDDALRTISGSVERINRLVQVVRTGLVRRAPTPVDLAPVVNDAIRLCSGHAPRPAVTLSALPLVVLTEGDRLAHGLAHLIRNAQQAASATGTVTVSLHGDASYAVITVADNGTGMSADFVRERLFRPFDSTKKGVSLGIGAAQIRDIVKSYGGTLGVQTNEGQGSIFTIRIPLHDAGSLVSQADVGA